MNRLTSVNYGDGLTQSYTFDPMGNRLTMTDGQQHVSTYNNANMLLTLDGNPYTNDFNGNTLTGGGRVNTWDSQNRLRQCVYGTTVSQFTYGSDGLRRTSNVNGTIRKYMLDNGMMVRETDTNGVSQATYLAGLRGPEYRRDDVNGSIKWYVFDGLGSVLAEMDGSNGTLTASRKLDVYGAPRATQGTPSSKHAFVGNLGHTTEPDTGGLVYMRARWMDPVTGTFLSEDPARDGANWFAYCGGDPVNRVWAKSAGLAMAFQQCHLTRQDGRHAKPYRPHHEPIGRLHRAGHQCARFRHQRGRHPHRQAPAHPGGCVGHPVPNLAHRRKRRLVCAAQRDARRRGRRTEWRDH